MSFKGIQLAKSFSSLWLTERRRIFIFLITVYFKFGSWTYSENLLNLEMLDGDKRHEEIINEYGQKENVTIVDDGIGIFKFFSIKKFANFLDLSDYYPSVEWDIMSRIGRRRSKNYPSCCPGSGAYVDIMVGREG